MNDPTKNDTLFKMVLWSVIIGQLAIIAWFMFPYHPHGDMRATFAPVVKSVNAMMPKLPSVILTEPTTILFMGTDVVYNGSRRHLTGDHVTLNGNSDTMMLCFLNPQHNKASVLNIPRDTEAYVGDHGIQKINSANPLGGPELAKSTVTGLLQVPVDHYIIMNIQGLVQMVNELGGITVNVPKKMSYMDWTAKLKIDLQPGTHTLTGNQAMGFVRFRHDGLGDIGRVQRQQIFLQAAARKMADPSSWVHVPALLAIAENNIQTDMNQIDLLSALNFLHTLAKDNIKFVMLPGQFSGNGDWIATTDGRTIAWQMANPNEENVSSRRNISICVINATTDRSFGSKLARSLRKLGYVTSVGPDEENPMDGVTQIIVQNGNTANAKMLQQDLGNVGDVVNASVGSLISSITVVVHNDLMLDNITLSSIDVPFEVSLARPQPLVSRALDPTSGLRRKRRTKDTVEVESRLPVDHLSPSSSNHANENVNLEEQVDDNTGASGSGVGAAEARQIPFGAQEVQPAAAAEPISPPPSAPSTLPVSVPATPPASAPVPLSSMPQPATHEPESTQPVPVVAAPEAKQEANKP